MEKTKQEYTKLAYQIIGAAIEVHRELGPGLLEAVYEHCMMEELKLRGIEAKNQVYLPIYYKGNKIDKYYKIDILVEDDIILELKCVETLLPKHEVQTVTYLKLANKKLGYLMNFNVAIMKDGIKRKVNNF